MTKLRILVTGGAGFIGSHLVDELIKKSYPVVVIDNLSHGQIKNISAPVTKFNFYKLDIRNPKLITVFKKHKPQIVFHLAAQTSVGASLKNPLINNDINLNGSINVFECARLINAQKIIFASTGGALYGNTKLLPTPETTLSHPRSPYGLSKLAAEEYLHYLNSVHKLSSVILRLSNVYGPRQNSNGEAGVIAKFSNLMLNNTTVTINGSGQQTRDFIYVKDVNRALLKAMVLNSGTFNIGTGQETSINQLYKTLAQLTNYQLPPQHNHAVLGEVQRSVLNIKLAATKLNWKPQTKLFKGLQLTIKYLKSNYI